MILLEKFRRRLWFWRSLQLNNSCWIMSMVRFLFSRTSVAFTIVTFCIFFILKKFYSINTQEIHINTHRSIKEACTNVFFSFLMCAIVYCLSGIWVVYTRLITCLSILIQYSNNITDMIYFKLAALTFEDAYFSFSSV